ncbi:CRISPR-associated protein, Csd1 family [Desulforamulus reducens MI-1]|uniref:CRISPR-associated protein, Csd1 family n=1 Tax=Desulforamulus reducens (strain ATCC BAA-1160 / DSM 100696 / MI-1) TaxID=349161 RepID=A4J386_DESRM|nr:type I-C CRISPR-associated protein Cas8c/Csd1 [Desulforamulus reducens]ABO49539.1 CRISPR-associated protein, Csd1 family [Desulforamulus reducens MI-1]
MIINALYQYYGTLLNDQDSGVSRPGFSKAKVGYCLVLSREGQLLDIIDLRVERNKKLVSREMDVPEQVKRASGVAANFLCDNCTYILGLGQKNKQEKRDRIKKCFEAFVQRQEEILQGVEDEGAVALLKFLRGWDIASAVEHPAIIRQLDGLVEGSNLVFKLEGNEGYIHERKTIREAWNRHRNAQVSDIRMQCLVTGEKTGIARLHPSIKGVTGAQPSGASLISFNLNSFTSYRKTQSFNAPVGEEAVFGYTTALNYLLGSEKHRIRIGDTTTVFWAEKSTNGLEEDLLGLLFFPVAEENGKSDKKDDHSLRQATRDPQTVKLLHDIFRRVKEGKAVSQELTGINLNTNFYILGLAPNASRLAVRFWHVDTYGKLIAKIAQHYRDMAMVKNFEKNPYFIPLGMILKETAPLKDSKRIAPLLGGVLMRAILSGTPYPMSLYSSMISRIRADQEVNYVRAAVIKACLVRHERFYNKGNEVELTVALNEQNSNKGYLLGRLFSLLEKAQEDANPGINSSIRDRYFGSASATPGSVFPILLRLAQHHITKAEYGRHTDKRIEDVISSIDGFPAYLTLEEQGQFVLGYYQQRQALYTKTEKKGELNNVRTN